MDAWKPVSWKRKPLQHQDSNWIPRSAFHTAYNVFRFSPTKQLLATMWIFSSTDSLAGSFCHIFIQETTSFWLGASVVVNISQNLITERTALLHRCRLWVPGPEHSHREEIWTWDRFRLQFREHRTFFPRWHCPSSIEENNFVWLARARKMISNMYTLQLFYYIVLSDEGQNTSRALTAVIMLSFFSTGS